MAMNGTVPPGTEAALVEWVNSFPLSDRVESLREMNDGRAIWEMLRTINKDSFVGELPSNKQSDYARQQNLLFIYGQLVSYLDGQDARYRDFSDYELKKIATGESSSSILKFLKLVLLVVISPPNHEIISKIPQLPSPTPLILQALFEEIDPARPPSENGDAPDTSDLDSGRESSKGSAFSSPTRRRDRELLLEEKLALVNAQLTRREAEVEDLKVDKEELSVAYLRLQDNYEAVKQSSAENEDRLKKLTSVHNEREQLSIRDLEAKISLQEETIGRQESQIAELQTNEAELQRRASKLSDVEEKFQKLQDEFHIQKVNLDEQTRRANAGDKYKQKVQATQGVERERDALRNQIDELRPRAQAYDEVRRENSKLKQENHEIGQTLSHSERSNNEFREMKQAYIAEIERFHRETKGLREALAQGQERIADLEDRSGGSEVHSSPMIVDGGLESELAETSKHEQQMQVARTALFWSRVLTIDRKSRIVELEKQNRQLTDDSDEKETTIKTIQRQLKNVQALSVDQDKLLQDKTQEITNLQSSLAEVRQGHPIEGTETFKRTREQLKIEQKKNVELEKMLSAAQKEVEAANDERTSSFDRHCLISELNIDLLQGALVDKPKLEIIEAVKKQSSMALMLLQSEHEALQLLHKGVQDENDRLKDDRKDAWYEAHEAVVAKGLADSDHAAHNQRLADLKDMIKKFSNDRSTESTAQISEALEMNIGVFARKIEESRERTLKQQQQIEKQEALIKDLETRLEQQKIVQDSMQSKEDAKEDAKFEETSPKEREYTQNLERELKLIASAYHDLAGRLQMNNVVLQRRAEAPKSWLGRQRKVMEGVGGLVR
ncbi:hypothetical protein JMJ35_009417 [Cladonia borealis]|uniref:HOOK N-terminal domain-containing protein n=1 Tax=Cladonia borealis TaxID=184061 RepID=A0AA39UY36_9LECA|nr:hypothetical protein JMJ35_009417 [Cladonia borealis]